MAFTAARVDAAVDTACANSTHLQLHDGDPGAGGTANIATQSAARIAFDFPAAGGDGITAQTGTFTIAGAEGPYTHVTGWSALTVGTHQFTATLTPQETFAGAGSLEVTVTVTGSST